MTATKTAAKAHIALHVKDLVRSLDFYRKLFGAEPVKLRRDYAKFDLTEPALNLTLNQSPSGESPAALHRELNRARLGDQAGSAQLAADCRDDRHREVGRAAERSNRDGLEPRERA